MSHFVGLVVLPATTTSLDEALGEVLARYDEQEDTPVYTTDCYCIGREARLEARRGATKQGLSVDVIRDQYWKDRDAAGERDSDDDKWEEEWQRRVAPVIAEEERLEKAHPLYQKPSPDCDECHGSGIRPSTYNPLSKWDWWTIGGRWSGMLDGYDPEKDPKNIETCDLCAGTGKRPDMDVKDGCNGCSGTGKRVKWPTDWEEHPGDISRVGNLKPGDKDQVPFALITSDGEWHEKGDMGWFGMVRDEKKKDDWHDEYQELISKEPLESIVVVVDFHI